MAVSLRVQQRLEEDPDGIASLCAEMTSVPAFVYNFVEDRYLCVAKSVTHLLPVDEITGKGMFRWIDRVHPEDFPVFFEAYLHDMDRLAHHRKGDPLLTLKIVAIRIANVQLEWIPTLIRTDVVGYDAEGKANCLFGLLLTEESLGKADESLLGKNDWQALLEVREKYFGKKKEQTAHVHITVREWEVLNLLREGLSTRQISAHLEISMHTVESHRKKLMQKFNSHTSAELIAKAATHYRWRDR
jgi:DNA-binding CsgD family transcriptional regulator